MKGNDRLILRSRDQNNLLHQFTTPTWSLSVKRITYSEAKGSLFINAEEKIEAFTDVLTQIRLLPSIFTTRFYYLRPPSIDRTIDQLKSFPWNLNVIFCVFLTSQDKHVCHENRNQRSQVYKYGIGKSKEVNSVKIGRAALVSSWLKNGEAKTQHRQRRWERWFL